MSDFTMAEIVSLAKMRGIIFPGSEIYDGLANSWDYGPLGVEMKNNVKRAWWKKFIQESPYNVGIDAAILMNPKTWEASGHLSGFSDPLMDCRSCNSRFRADKIIADDVLKKDQDLVVDGWSNQEMRDYIETNQLKCPACGKSDFTDIREFNLMFKTFQGVNQDTASEIFLRPETAQGIFVNFKNVQRSSRKKIPFGIGQIGKSFRNEITPGNFIFRTREFEQMELQFFCAPGTDLEWFDYWKDFCRNWLFDLGMTKENIRFRDHEEDELSHYSNATVDVEFKYPFGWGELWGIADRTDYDLTQHQKHSGKDMSFTDPQTNEKYIPYCIEPSLGVDRMFLAFLCDAMEKETITSGDKEEERKVMRIHPFLAAYKAAILPLSKKLSETAQELYQLLAKDFMVEYDEAGSIGKRYRRQDEIGTPFCITIDFETLDDRSVTVRDRDSMDQIRLPITEVSAYIQKHISF